MHRWSIGAIVLLFACQSSYSSKFQNEEGGFPQPSRLLKNAQGENQSYAAIGRLQAAMSCTASLWKPSPDPAAPVLAITNGHCVMPYTDRSSSFDVWVDRPAPESWTLSLNYFVDTVSARKVFGIKKIVYATMKATDLALVELKTTWTELSAAGIEPLPQATEETPAGKNIRVLGIPLGGADSFLREAECVEETRVSLIEWYWSWYDTHRNSCSDIREGSSGSPVLSELGEVYAVINTTSTGGISESCYLGNPCEIQERGATLIARKNYAMSVVGMNRCFASGSLQFGSSCPLPSPVTVGYTQAPQVPTQAVDRQGQPILWNIQSTSSDPQNLRWKFGFAGETDCRADADYRVDFPTGSPLPTVHGLYLLCIKNLENDERFPTQVVLSLDTKGPTLQPQLSVRANGSSVAFEPIFQVPELSGFSVGFGPRDSTNCETLKLSPYRRVPIRIEGKILPARVCVQGEDHAGNRGPVFAYEINAGEAPVDRLESEKASQSQPPANKKDIEKSPAGSSR